MAAQQWEPDGQDDLLEDPDLPEAGLPPDPDPDWASRARLWVNVVPVLQDPDEDPGDEGPDEEWARGGRDCLREDPLAVPEDRPPAPLPVGAAPRQLLALLAGVETGSLVYEQAADALVAVRRSRSFLDACEARLLDRMQTAAEQEQPCAGAPEDCTREATARTARLAAAAVAEEAALLLRIPRREASARLETARQLAAGFTRTLRALADGEVTAVQAQVIADESRFLPGAARPAFEAELLQAAARLTRPALLAKARRLRERLHPETIAARRARAEADRCVELRPLEDGMAWLGLYLPAEQAVAAFNRIQDTAVQLQGPGECRTLAQLRADVAATLLLTGPDGPGGADRNRRNRYDPQLAGPAAQVVLTVPVLSLLGLDGTPAELEGYGPVPVEAARRLAADAPSFTRLLTDPVGGAVLSLGRRQYRPTKAQRRFLQIRDRTCRFPGCRRSARSTDLDHTLAWHRGGPTDVDNLAHLCPLHHGLKTAGLWTARQPHAGTISWTSPAGRTYTDHPEPVAAIPPENLCTVLERLEIEDLNRRLKALYSQTPAAGQRCPSARAGPSRRRPALLTLGRPAGIPQPGLDPHGILTPHSRAPCRPARRSLQRFTELPDPSALDRSR